MQRRGGLISFKVGGRMLDAKGNFTYNMGVPKREAIVGADRVHGTREIPQVAFIEGEITDALDIDNAALASLRDVTVFLEIGNGATLVGNNMSFSGTDGNIQTDEGNMQVRFEGTRLEKVR